MRSWMVLAFALLGACGREGGDHRLGSLVANYCESLPSSYKLLADSARAGHYQDVQAIWAGPDAAANVHRYFELCLSTSSLGDTERRRVVDRYFQGIRQVVGPLLADMLLHAEAQTEPNKAKLVQQFEEARSLAELVAGSPPK